MYNEHRSINPAVVLCYIDNAAGLGLCPPKDPLYKVHVKRVYITPNMIVIYYNAYDRYTYKDYMANNNMCSCVAVWASKLCILAENGKKNQKMK